jgi:hypothetical protein
VNKNRIDFFVNKLNKHSNDLGDVDYIYKDTNGDVVIEGIGLSKYRCIQFGLNPKQLVVHMGEEFDKITIPNSCIPSV